MGVFGFMKNIDVEEKIDPLHNVRSIAGPLNPLLRAIQRVIEYYIHKGFRSIYQDAKASNKEMAS